MVVAAAGDPSLVEQIGPTLIAVVVTALLGLAAAWFGRVWERDNSHRDWLRDKRHEAATELITRAHAYTDLTVDTRLAVEQADGEADSVDSEDHARAAELINRLASDYTALVSAQSAIEVLGPDELAIAARGLVEALHAAGSSAVYTESNDRSGEVADTHRSFVALARSIVADHSAL